MSSIETQEYTPVETLETSTPSDQRLQEYQHPAQQQIRSEPTLREVIEKLSDPTIPRDWKVVAKALYGKRS